MALHQLTHPATCSSVSFTHIFTGILRMRKKTPTIYKNRSESDTASMPLFH